MKPRYRVLTWDVDLQKFTPQIGVRQGPYSLWGLRRAVRKLRDLGYSCHRGDSFVWVNRIEAKA